MRKNHGDDAVPAAKQTPENSFRAVVRQCVDSYTLFGDDSLSLDYNRVLDAKLRAMILQDPEYRRETRYIRAKKVMDDIHEIDELGRLAAGMCGDDEEEIIEETYDVRGMRSPQRQTQKKKKISTADKDMLNMRFKAAQERRALLSGINKADGDELDAVNIFFVPLSREEFSRIETVEIFDERESDDAEAMAALAGSLKEKLPEGEQISNNRLKPGRSGEPPNLGFDEEGNVILC
jgi:hypothetical protein